MNTQSSKGKYMLAVLVGAAAGGAIVALSTRAVPKMMSGMMAGMAKTDGEAGDVCQRMMAGMGQAPEQEACHSQGGSCHGSD
jgi:hypothetical protein